MTRGGSEDDCFAVYESNLLVKLVLLHAKPMSEVSLDQLSAGQFAELVQTRFQISVEPSPAIILELIAVSAPGPRGPGSVSPETTKFESFSLLFSGPLDRPLGQGTHRFDHAQLGSFDLFIVPVCADRGARQYEAVFNRRLTSGPAA